MKERQTFFHPDISGDALRAEIQRLQLASKSEADYKIDTRLHFFDRFAEELTAPEFSAIEGIAFLSIWLKEKNLRRLLEINLGPLTPALDRFIPLGNVQLRAAPRGIAAHWIAGNIPTLTFFSFAVSFLAKNANLIRVSKASVHACKLLFETFLSTSIQLNGIPVTGKDLLQDQSIVHFDSENHEMNRMMSLAADVRIVWGGAEAVDAVSNLPRHEHTEDVIFGPKFSIAAIDAAMLESETSNEIVRNLCRDIILFDQTACSSPHIVFVEGNLEKAKDFAAKIQSNLERISSRSPLRTMSESTAATVLSTRAEYALSDDSDVLCPASLDYSVFIDTGVRLTEAIQSRSVFVRGVPSLLDLAQLLSPKIQTIGIAIADHELRMKFCEMAARNGVSRCVPPGLMNAFDIPWDGMRIMDRLIRWVVMHERL